MHLRKLIICQILGLIFCNATDAQTYPNHEHLVNLASFGFKHEELDTAFYHQQARQRSAAATRRINLFVFSAQQKINLANFLIRTSTRYAAMFHKNVSVLKVHSIEDLQQKLDKLLAKYPDAMIGTFWLDSHGVYISGHSLVVIGKDSLNYTTVRDKGLMQQLLPISVYCDEKTTLVLGACYSSASYNRPGNNRIMERPMNGDSLMLGFNAIFPFSPILGTESWIMTEPFLFGKKWGLAGFPLDRKFRDEIYQPAWQRMGIWKELEPTTGKIRQIRTIYLDKRGEIRINDISYLDLPKARKKMERHLETLKPGVYHF